MRMAIADSTFHPPKQEQGKGNFAKHECNHLSFQAYSRHGAHPQGMAHTAFPALRQPGTGGSACHEWTSTYSPLSLSLWHHRQQMSGPCSAVHSRLPADRAGHSALAWNTQEIL